MADPGIEPTGAPLADIVAEAGRVLDAAEAQGVPLRLIGGVAVKLHTPAMSPALARTYGDIDTATVKGQNRPVTDLMTGLGYEPARQVNAPHGPPPASSTPFTGPPSCSSTTAQMTASWTCSSTDSTSITRSRSPRGSMCRS